MKTNKIIIEKEIAGKKLTIETGHLAKQANGSVLIKYNETVVLVTVTISEKPRQGIDFFPLVVDFEEKLYAAGRIPGGFIKREGRPSEKSILTSRLIDRPIRPLFPEKLRHEVQIIAITLSSDQENDADIPAMIGASAALAISEISFDGPVGAVRIGLIDGEYIINPTFQQLKKSKLNLVVAGTKHAITMVEASASEVTEEEIMPALEIAHENIKVIVEIIEELQKKCGSGKIDYPLDEPDRDLEHIIKKHFAEKIKSSMKISGKKERNKALDSISKEALIETLADAVGEQKERLLGILTNEKSFDFEYIVKKIEEEELKKLIIDEEIRPDGRKFNEIRPISCEAGILPRTHGSGLFTRGQTQVLTSVTLGAISEEQTLDDLGGTESKRYMHQYNFPPFSVGEVRPSRGPGRREIGHGSLAERSLLPMIPQEDTFPYAIRLVSEALESNGSTSMASVCASTLALMDAGVPIKKPVAGIAMGMVCKDDKFVILTDIQGMEDVLGEMDFKVAGTSDGITALQMDIKIKGISSELLKKALFQAKDARLFILEKIKECLPSPRPSISPHAPTIFTIVIHPDKIRDVIGPGGKIINKIIGETGAKIDIEDDGRIYVASVDKEMGMAAQKMIEEIAREAEVGEVYLGKVVRIVNFGAFVELWPGKEGLVHISQLAPYRVNRVEDVVKIGDEITVRVNEIDSMGRINLTRKDLASSSEAPPPGRPHGGGYEQKSRFSRPKF